MAFKTPSLGQTRVDVWEERDRLHIHLIDNRTDKTLAEWWDDDAREMFVDGFFTNRRLHESVYKYWLDVSGGKPFKYAKRENPRKGKRRNPRSTFGALKIGQRFRHTWDHDAALLKKVTHGYYVVVAGRGSARGGGSARYFSRPEVVVVPLGGGR